jgi:hypothetical protein
MDQRGFGQARKRQSQLVSPANQFAPTGPRFRSGEAQGETAAEIARGQIAEGLGTGGGGGGGAEQFLVAARGKGGGQLQAQADLVAAAAQAQA